MNDKPINQRLFDGTFAEAALEELLDEAGVEFEKIGWDHYDNSLELYDVPPEYRLSDEAKKVIFDAGFSICYMNHTDKWETHYSQRNLDGWRVSYPHVRNDGTPSIWLEKAPPASWRRFKTLVKKAVGK
jgi:predicted deacetylase